MMAVRSIQICYKIRRVSPSLFPCLLLERSAPPLESLSSFFPAVGTAGLEAAAAAAMGAGGNLFGRAISYVVNEFLVEGLANKSVYASLPWLYACGGSQTFQRFAVKTNRTLQELSAKGVERQRTVNFAALDLDMAAVSEL
ncbi:hypothetical protein Taro_046480 [Colocasia esculenta]|uniref:Uncharacterized protein n=1 Tax=Colocasia esculenta TaxID=4460 RepID=A0A843X5M4_COLES|nr:hypothetical protein [Colocasia esculenta]